MHNALISKTISVFFFLPFRFVFSILISCSQTQALDTSSEVDDFSSSIGMHAQLNEAPKKRLKPNHQQFPVPPGFTREISSGAQELGKISYDSQPVPYAFERAQSCNNQFEGEAPDCDYTDA